MEQSRKQKATGSTKNNWSLGTCFKIILPVILGYLPVGFAYGVLAMKNGLNCANTMLMSILVFAGSAQLIAIGLFSSGVGPAGIIITTFIVNLRHLLMSAAMSPFLRNWSRPAQAWFAFQLTDETFALHSSRFSKQACALEEVLALNMIAQLAWIGGTFLGIISSNLIKDTRPIGLDFALPAMFIVLLVWQVTDKAKWATALTGGTLAIFFRLVGLDQVSTIGATVLAATLGLGVEAWTKK